MTQVTDVEAAAAEMVSHIRRTIHDEGWTQGKLEGGWIQTHYCVMGARDHVAPGYDGEVCERVDYELVQHNASAAYNDGVLRTQGQVEERLRKVELALDPRRADVPEPHGEREIPDVPRTATLHPTRPGCLQEVPDGVKRGGAVAGAVAVPAVLLTVGAEIGELIGGLVIMLILAGAAWVAHSVVDPDWSWRRRPRVEAGDLALERVLDELDDAERQPVRVPSFRGVPDRSIPSQAVPIRSTSSRADHEPYVIFVDETAELFRPREALPAIPAPAPATGSSTPDPFPDHQPLALPPASRDVPSLEAQALTPPPVHVPEPVTPAQITETFGELA